VFLEVYPQVLGVSTHKVCTKCGQEKPSTAFNSDKTKSDGRYPSCKACANAAAKEFRHNNHDHVLERGKRYRVKHAEKRRAYQRQYRIEHPGYYSDYLRQWAKDNPLKVAAYRKKTRETTNKHESHKIGMRIRQARIRASGTFTRHDVELLKRNQTDKKGRICCWWCKKPIDKWHIDHVIPIARGGTNTPGNLCLSCPSCNQSKSARTPGEWAGRLF
jgi:hypothetical protein